MQLRAPKAILIGCSSSVLLCGIVGCHGRLKITSGAFGANSESVKQEKTLLVAAGDATRLHVESDFGSIESNSIDGEKIDVKAEVSASGPYSKKILTSWLDKATVVSRRDGRTVVVETKAPTGMPKDIGLTSSYTLTAPKLLGLDLKTDNGKVTANGAVGDVSARSSFGSIDVRDVKGKVSAKTDNGSVVAVNITGDTAARSSFGELKLERIRGLVTCTTDNGRIAATDITGDTTVTSSFGSVLLKNVEGAVDAKSDNGKVEAIEVRAQGKPVALRSSFGDVSFAGIADGLTMKTDNGGVHATLQSVPRQTSMNSSFGSVTVELPRGAGADVEARTSFGSIKVDGVPGTVTRGDTKDWTGRIGSGGPKVKLSTDNGSITIRAR